MTAPPSRSGNVRPPDDAAFDAIAELARAEAGLVLSPGKATMVHSRLRNRLRELKMPDLDVYSRFVCSDEGTTERRLMISALTTNVSHFFRESHHFSILCDEVLPRLVERARAGGRVRIWSAGCSSGQEPYTIAMCIMKFAPDIAQRDVLILGSDIDPRILEIGTEAVYSPQQIAGIPKDMCDTYLEPHGNDGDMRVKAAVRKLVRFRELNLMGPWPMKQRFDVVFCRNVVIYFDAETQNALWPRFRNVLADDGWLFAGHSERVSDEASHLFASAGQTAYRAAAPAGT
ncbi:MAG: CheR family methyltransferase [Pseudooceanicola sp.]